MDLLTRIKELLDLDDSQIAKKEASSKFTSTLMLVNGTLAKIREFKYSEDCILVEHSTGFELIQEVKSLDIFLPTTGLYSSQDGRALLITKKPIKQWCKSYHSSFYMEKTVGSIGREKELSIFEVYNSKCTEIFVDKQKQIWYLDSVVGCVDNSSRIVCTDSRFTQEIIDWSRNDASTFR